MNHDKELTEAICSLTCAVRGLGEQLENENKMILKRIEKKVDDMAANFKDWAATNGPKLVKIQEGIDRAQALIETMQNSPGNFSAADQATADELERVLDTIGTDADSVPTPPVA